MEIPLRQTIKKIIIKHSKERKMKKFYSEPQLEVVQLLTTDIMTLSSGDATITGSIDPAMNDEIWDLT